MPQDVPRGTFVPSECSLNLMFRLCASAADCLAQRGRLTQNWLIRIWERPIPIGDINDASGQVPMARYVPPVTSVTHRCGVEFHTTKRNWRWEHDEWFPLKCLRFLWISGPYFRCGVVSLSGTLG